MSRLCIAIGFTDTTPRALPHLVYLGRDGAEMQAAINASIFPRLTVLPHAVGFPKNNVHAAANAAKVVQQKATLDNRERFLDAREKQLAAREAALASAEAKNRK